MVETSSQWIEFRTELYKTMFAPRNSSPPLSYFPNNDDIAAHQVKWENNQRQPDMNNRECKQLRNASQWKLKIKFKFVLSRRWCNCEKRFFDWDFVRHHRKLVNIHNTFLERQISRIPDIWKMFAKYFCGIRKKQQTIPIKLIRRRRRRKSYNKLLL